jgi:hypothetical protein
MARSNRLRIAIEAGPNTRSAGIRRRCGWLILTTLALGLCDPPPSHGQLRGPDWSAPPSGGVPIVLAEGGDSSLFLPLGVSVLGLAVFDIVTASSSAETINARREKSFRSPGTAFAVSAAATVVPLAVAYAGVTEIPELLIVGGIILGPSAGHVYAGRPWRGLLTAALRAGLGIFAFAAVMPST